MALIDSTLFPLGLLVPTPGTPVGLFENVPALASETSVTAAVLLFQAHPDNSGKVYIGNSTLDVAEDTGINYILMTGGDSFSMSSHAMNIFELQQFRVDVESAGDGVFVSIHVR